MGVCIVYCLKSIFYYYLLSYASVFICLCLSVWLFWLNISDSKHYMHQIYITSSLFKKEKISVESLCFIVSLKYFVEHLAVFVRFCQSVVFFICLFSLNISVYLFYNIHLFSCLSFSLLLMKFYAAQPHFICNRGIIY